MLTVRPADTAPRAYALEPIPEGGKAEDVAHVTLKPWGSSVSVPAQTAALIAVAAGASQAQAGVAFTLEAIVAAAVGWGWVGDEAGVELTFTPDNLRALLDQNEAVYHALDAAYVTPAVKRSAAKNA